MIRLGVLGAGNHSSEVHGEALKWMGARGGGRFEIAAVCDLDADRARVYCERFGAIQAYTDIEDMLATEQLDALMAITPIAYTERIVTGLLAAGIPLLVEKPPGETAAATQRLADRAAECGTPHMVSFNRRFAPALIKAREWIAADGEQRRPRLVAGRMLRRNRLESNFVTGTAIHQVDAVLSVMGRPAGLRSRHMPGGKDGVEIVDYQIDFVDGGRATCLVAPDAGVPEETYEIIGENYAIMANALTGEVAVCQSGEVVMQWAPAADAVRVERDGTVAETEAFLDAVAGTSGFHPTLAESVLSMLATEAVAAGGEHWFD